MSVRKNVVVIFAVLESGASFHFCSHPLLSGKNNELWYPLPHDVSLFNAIENVMIDNNQANNVTRVEELRVNGKSVDYLVTYNQFSM